MPFSAHTSYPVQGSCFDLGPASTVPPSLAAPAISPQTAALPQYLLTLSDRQYQTDSCGRFVRLAATPEDSANLPIIPGNFSHVEEVAAVGEKSLSEQGEADGPRDGSIGSWPQQSSVDDHSPSRPSSHGLNPSRPSSQNGPFVNLSVRDGHLYSDKKRIAVNDIGAHSFEQISERKQRGRFTEDRRRETGKTRRMRACFRCHTQRVRCLPNPDNPNDPKAQCATCLTMAPTKKVIHHLPCARFRVTSIVLYRSGGLNLTTRWTGTQVRNVGDWADDSILDVEMTQGLSHAPIRFRVRRFRPRAGDVLCRRWVDKDGPKKQDLSPFALANIHETANDFNIYLKTNAHTGLVEAVKDSDEIIRRTYEELISHYQSLPGDVEGPKTKCNEEKKLALSLINLAFAIRHMTGSAWLCGKETLGIQPSTSPSNPIYGRRSLPRMIVAQFDSIQCEIILKKTTPSVLKQLETFTSRNNPSTWFTLYLVTFVLLHEISHSTRDRYRHARENSASSRYGSLGRVVEQMQEGANILLAIWQYYKCVDLVNFDWKTRMRTDNHLKKLTPKQAEFVRWSVESLKLREPFIPKTPDTNCWEHPLYFVSHMYKEWHPLPTYNHVET